MTRDDLLASNQEMLDVIRNWNASLDSQAGKDKTIWTFVVEEKVDGANIAFSLGENGDILAQNRSHYVDEGSHAQFRRLRPYIKENEKDIRLVLGGGRFILYGEWLYAKHSISYTALPSFFISFDLVSKFFPQLLNFLPTTKATVITSFETFYKVMHC